MARTIVEVEVDVDDMMDWGLLGYGIGEVVQEDIPVLAGIRHTPSMIKLKHFGAAAASSGGVEMYHIPGVTPEADTIEQAFGKKKPVERIKYGHAERKLAYENLNSSAKDTEVDFVMLGCPHNSIEQVWIAARLLDGKKLSPTRSSGSSRRARYATRPSSTATADDHPQSRRPSDERHLPGDRTRDAQGHARSLRRIRPSRRTTCRRS